MSNVQVLAAMRLNLQGFQPTRASKASPKKTVSINTRVQAKAVAPPAPVVSAEGNAPVESVPAAGDGAFMLPAMFVAGIASVAAALDSIFLTEPVPEVLAQTEPWSPFAAPVPDDDGWDHHHHHHFGCAEDPYHHDASVFDDSQSGISDHDYMAASRGD